MDRVSGASSSQDRLVVDVTDDNASQWSMTEYGSLDWDHSGDEFDRIQVLPKITRRASSVSPRDAAKLRDASLKSTTFSDHQVRGSETARILSVRSSRGAVKIRSSSVEPVMPIRRKARSAPPSGNRNIHVVRDAHGRFARKTASPSTIQSRKRSASTPATRASAPPGYLSERSMFGLKRETPIPPPKRIDFKALKFSPIVASSSLASATPAEKDASPKATPDMENSKVAAKRDSKGRFASKSKPVADTQEIVETSTERIIEVILPVKPKTKSRRAPAKSPYFTPPVTPAKPRKVKKEDTSEFNPEESQKLSPIKDGSTPPSSQGSAKKRIPGKTVSCIPFPPLSAPHFGLIQEKLAHNPFRLLIAVTFLIRTHGKHAIPVFYQLMEKYPSPEALVAADKADIVPIIRHLGLQNQRAATYQTYAKIWLEDPPMKDKRYPVRGYPEAESGRDIKKGETILDTDERLAWEIGHMTQGPYAIDSWRIFCRDVLRGVAEGYNGEGTAEGFQPEWMRVVPEDKELRAYLRWMWLKEGFEWDPFTGEKDVAEKELMRAAMEGRVAWDDEGGMRILDEVLSLEPGLSQVGNL
ncbi:hypothetical protein VTL71DRAFT_12042 [Oculimacula yallundae]|uniref:HhH-GPD domain-containing protein n=1 Tax=Oculimacula yallundae TaxID=86028 RepID=A0ABR4CRT8_9HELO